MCAVNYAGTDWLNASEMKKITTEVRTHPYGAADVPLVPERGAGYRYRP